MSEVKKIYIAHFLVGFSAVASVTWTLYFLSHNISQSQIALLFSVFMIVLSICDIPTGSFADIFGHKKSVILGTLFQSLTGLIFFLMPSFTGFFIGMILAGIGLAFESGALSSLIYDLLAKTSQTEDFQKIKGKADGYLLIASIFAGPIGSIIYKYYPSIPNLLYFIAIILSSFVFSRIKWEFTRKPHNMTSFTRKIQEGLHLTIKSRRLMALILIGMVLTISRMLFNQNISQPYQVQVGIDVIYIGFTAAAVCALQAFISINAYKLYKKLGIGISLWLIVFIPSISLLILSFMNTIYALTFILFFYMGHAFRDPVFATISHNEVSNDHRATMFSTISFFTSIIVAILLPIWGYGIDSLGIKNILFGLFLFTLVVGSIGIFIFDSTKK